MLFLDSSFAFPPPSSFMANLFLFSISSFAFFFNNYSRFNLNLAFFKISISPPTFLLLPIISIINLLLFLFLSRQCFQ